MVEWRAPRCQQLIQPQTDTANEAQALLTVTIFVTASVAALTSDEPADNQAPPTIEDAQKLVQTISDRQGQAESLL